MGKVIANMSMSLDGFVADPADGIDQLFGWMGNGDVEVPTAVDWVTFRMSPVTHEPPTDWSHTDTFTFVDSIESAVELAQQAAG